MRSPQPPPPHQPQQSKQDVVERAGPVRLSAGVDEAYVADVCRAAALSFCRGVAAGWSKRELARWLTGPYAKAIDCADRSESDSPPPSSDPQVARARLEPGRIATLLDPAWHGAVSCIEAFSEDRGEIYRQEAYERRSVAFARDARDRLVVAPVHRARLSLAVRVRSLLVADFHARPHDYLGACEVCSCCGVLLLGDLARQRGYCEDHPWLSETRALAGVDVNAFIPQLPWLGKI